MRVTLRPMSSDDLALVNRWRALAELSGFADETDRGGLVIELDGEPVGWIDPHEAYAPAWRDLLGPSVGERPFTIDLFVLPERWNQGIGRAAIRLASDRCRRDGATCMVVDIEPANHASARTFAAAGWAAVEVPADSVVMRYPADPAVRPR